MTSKGLCQLLQSNAIQQQDHKRFNKEISLYDSSFFGHGVYVCMPFAPGPFAKRPRGEGWVTLVATLGLCTPGGDAPCTLLTLALPCMFYTHVSKPPTSTRIPRAGGTPAPNE